MKKSQISNLESQVSKRGFSLVELIVVMAIIVLMTAVLFLNQNKNKAQSEVEAAARQVAAQLRSLQNDALNGKMIEDKTYCRTNFTVISKDKYDTYFYESCSGIESPKSINIFSLKNVEFKDTSYAVRFKSPTGEVTCESDANKMILISTKDSSKGMVVCISDSGSIIEEKGTDASVCP